MGFFDLVNSVVNSVKNNIFRFSRQGEFFINYRDADEFWKIYVADKHPMFTGYRWTPNNAWLEWDSIKLCCTPYCKEPMDYLLNDCVVEDDGYVWSWGLNYKWPDGSIHYDQIPRFINAVYNYYVWTGDFTWLCAIWPKVLRVEKFLGTPLFRSIGSGPDNYMDQIKFEAHDAWINAAVYTAYRNLHELYKVFGIVSKYREYADRHKVLFNETFWTGERYCGWKNLSGQIDYEFPFVNLEALARGLGDQRKADKIFNWLDNDYVAYDYEFAPRTNTIPISKTHWDGWSDPISGQPKFGTLLQNGGAFLWVNYYDVMARLMYQTPDKAYVHYKMMMDRFMGDSQRLTFTGSRKYTDRGESITEIGTSQGPENGIAIMSLLYGFMGVEATIEGGLDVYPQMPAHLRIQNPNLSVKLFHRGEYKTISV